MTEESRQVYLSIIIVSWNVQEHLRRCLNSLRADADRGLEREIIVVDNNSADGTVAMLERDFPEVKLIHNQDNIGFARANNQGIEVSRGRFVLLLNPDTEVEKGCLNTLISFLQDHDQVGLVGPKLLNPDGTVQASGVNFPSLAKNLLGYFRFKKGLTGAYFIHADQPIAVNALVGACLLVRRAVIDQVGGLDEDYFMYVEEADWCYRIDKAGWLIYYLPSAVVYHHRGQSAAHMPSKMYVALRKSQILFALKHRSRLEALLLSLGYGASSAFKAVTGDKNTRPTFQRAASELFSTALALFAGRTQV